MPQLIFEEKNYCESTSKRLLPWPGETCPGSLASSSTGVGSRLSQTGTLWRGAGTVASEWFSSVYQPCGCPPPSEGAGWADCVRLPGNISSFLFLKAHNFQSDISPLMTSKGISISSYNKHTLDQPNFTHSPTSLYTIGEAGREYHAACVRATGNDAINTTGPSKDPGGQHSQTPPSYPTGRNPVTHGKGHMTNDSQTNVFTSQRVLYFKKSQDFLHKWTQIW